MPAWFPEPTRQGVAAPGLQTLTGAERLLWEASERALRHPRNRLVLVLHLSRLTPPAPRSYHIRIARVLMQDSAARFDGQVFAMRNQDLVLLCRNGGTLPGQSAPLATDATRLGQEAGDEFAANPQSLPAMLGRLFSADADPVKLTSLWHLDGQAPCLLSYLAERASGPVPAEAIDEQSDAVLSAAALQGIMAKAPLSELLFQQTGMSLDPDRGKSLADRLAPAFRELELSLAALNLGPLVSRATADPFLFRHLASGFDDRFVALLAENLTEYGRLTRTTDQARLPTHINLGLEAILSPGFALLSNQAASKGLRLGASVSLMQACADLDLMEQARRVLTSTGMRLILTHVDPAALSMVKPAKLQPDLIKIVWSPALLTGLPDGQGVRREHGRLDDIGTSRVVLQNVDSHHALAWGQAQGISLFQGVFLDQAQAATRMAECRSASGCTMRQCGARASSASMTGRTGCSNPGLLDAERRAMDELEVLLS